MKICRLFAKHVTTSAVALFAIAGTASAGTFLQVFEQDSTQTLFQVTNTAGTGNSVSISSGAVDFVFSVPNALGTGIRLGTINLSATTSALPSANGGNLIENGYSGTGSIIDTLTGTVAFSWTFGPSATLTVAQNGSGGTFTDSLPPAGEVVMSSQYLTFSDITAESFSFGLSGGTPPFTLGAGGYLSTAQASDVATFSSTPLPNSVPEPATLSVMGSALLGLGIWGRRRSSR